MKYRFPQNWKNSPDAWTCTKMWKLCYFYSKVSNTFKMAYPYCFSRAVGNLNYPDFLQKGFYNIDSGSPYSTAHWNDFLCGEDSSHFGLSLEVAHFLQRRTRPSFNWTLSFAIYVWVCKTPSFTDCAKSQPLCASFTDGFWFFWMQLLKLKNSYMNL